MSDITFLKISVRLQISSDVTKLWGSQNVLDMIEVHTLMIFSLLQMVTIIKVNIRLMIIECCVF